MCGKIRLYLISGCLALIPFSHASASSAALGGAALSDLELANALKRAIHETSSFQDKYEAEVWLADMSHRLRHRLKNHQERLNLLTQVHREARQAGLPPELVLAVIDVESNFDRWAISKAGARGLMQVMPFWLDEIGRPNDNLFSVNTNLRMGCTILKHYLNKEGGNLIRALGRYNGSLGSFRYPDKVMTVLRNRWYRP